MIPGTSGQTLLVGNVLGFEERYVGGEVLVDATGLIGCVGCDCAAVDPGDRRALPDRRDLAGPDQRHDHLT